MIKINKTSSETVTHTWPDFTTIQVWVIQGDVTTETSVNATGVAVAISGGSPGTHQITYKVSGRDPEEFDQIEVTVTL